jgi:hypothetical protein
MLIGYVCWSDMGRVGSRLIDTYVIINNEYMKIVAFSYKISYLTISLCHAMARINRVYQFNSRTLLLDAFVVAWFVEFAFLKLWFRFMNTDQ